MPDPRSRRTARSTIHRLLPALLLLAVPSRPVRAQVPVLVQGLLDVEGWETGRGSRLTARNDGRPAALGRLALWSAAEPYRGLIVHAQLEAASGTATGEEHAEVELEQWGLRWQRSPRLVLDAGKMTSTVGAFAGRRMSSHNPLIGRPDGYPVAYPIGLRASGEVGRVDYRVALSSLPPTDERYVPAPTPRPRLALGAGVTPVVGSRIGASFTRGTYLNDAIAPSALFGAAWRDFRQTVMAFDAQFSRGYFEVRGELGYGWYEVPGVAKASFGLTHYTEARYTLTPRIFIAARGEQNRYPYLQPPADGATAWTHERPTVTDAELGFGYRIGPKSLFKASFRRDWWTTERYGRAFLPDGYAWAMQLSQGFDLLELVRR